MSRISIYIANRCLRSWKIFAINVTRRDCSTFNDKKEKTRPFPSLFPSLSSPSLSSASYKRRISRSAELRQKLARDKRVWREKRICHPLGAMLWCIVAKWMLNGLPALRDVKAFFSKIAAEICSAPRGLPRRPISDFHAWKGETARGGRSVWAIRFAECKFAYLLMVGKIAAAEIILLYRAALLNLSSGTKGIFIYLFIIIITFSFFFF